MNLIEYISKFKIIKLSVNVKAIDIINLASFKGGALRGAFGYALKKIFCDLSGGDYKTDCKTCSSNQICNYLYVFETPIPFDSEVMKKYPNAPHPFVINPPLTNSKCFNPGDHIEFTLVLIGVKSCLLVPNYIYAFDEMGRSGIGKNNGRFIVDSVYSSDQAENKTKIFDGLSSKFISEPVLINFSDNNNLEFFNNKIKVKFLTPTRIQFEDKISNKIEFHILVRNLLRRISQLYYFHINKDKMNIDFNYFINNSINTDLEWNDFKRDSIITFNKRQGQKIRMDGIIGEATYKSVSAEFIPLLKLGEYLNVGKGTSFGLGRYQFFYTT